MADAYDYGKRADEIADATRRFLVGLNTGGIGVTLTIVTSFADRGIPPDWSVVPVALFVAGLGVSGSSLLFAKHKAVKRRKAATNGQPIPPYEEWYQRNFTYEVLALLLFLGAATCGLTQMANLQIPLEKKSEQRGPKDSPPNPSVQKGTPQAARP